MQTNLNARAEREPGFHQVWLALRRWWLTLAGVWLALVLVGLTGVAFLRPNFQCTGSIYLEDQSAAKSLLNALSTVSPMVGGDTKLESQKEVLRSTKLALLAIRAAGLNAKLTGDRAYLPARPYFWQWRLQRDPTQFARGLRVRDCEVAPNLFTPVTLEIRFTGTEQFEVWHAGQAVGQGSLDQVTHTPQASFQLTTGDTVQVTAGSEFTMVIKPAAAVMRDYFQNLSIEGGGSLARKNDLITLSFTHESPYAAQQVVNFLQREFLELNQYWATSTSRALLEFVAQQSQDLERDLNESTQRLAQFQTDSGLIKLDTQVEASVANIVKFETDLRKQKIYLFELEQFLSTLGQSEGDVVLMPTVEDRVVQTLSTKLTELNSQIASVGSQFREDYPPLVQLKSARATLIGDMKAALHNLVEQARTQEQQLSKAVEQYKAQLITMPEQARALTDFLRSSKVYEELYLLLLEEKQKAKIAEASTLSNLRIVDEPIIPVRENAPRLSVMVIGVFFTAGVLAGLMVLVPATRIRWFSTLDEVKAAFPQRSVYAVIPHRGKEAARASTGLIEESLRSPFAEAIRLLRGNLLHTMAGKTSQTVLITSPMPRDGKSSIFANLGIALAKSERVNRVLLIDCDMHHPSQHGVFALPQTPGLSEYLNGECALEDIIRSYPLSGGKSIDVITAGRVPPSPVELVDTQAMQKLIEYATQTYTFKLIDTPPFPLLATALVLAPRVDRILTVCRLGQTDRSLMMRHVDELSDHNSHHGLIVNVGQRGTAYGTYGYGYGYGSEYYGEKAEKRIAAAANGAAVSTTHGPTHGNGNGAELPENSGKPSRLEEPTSRQTTKV